MIKSRWALLGLFIASPVWAQPAGGCDGGLASFQKAPALRSSFTGMKQGSASCNSLQNVLRRLAGTSTSAGKKLEGDKPLDVAAATRERQQAHADPEFAKALQEAQAPESDALRRLVLEAALLEEFGHFAARELVLREAQALLGK